MKRNIHKLFNAACALVVLNAGAVFTCAQTPNGTTGTRSFEFGEELIYVGEFSRALLKNIDVADFRFTANREALPSSEQSESKPYSLKFTGDVSSKGFFSKLFNLRFRQRVESTVEPVSFTVQRTKRLDEQNKRARDSEAIYDLDRREVHWTERDPNNPSRAPRTASSSFNGQVQDVLSAIYYLRTQSLQVGKDFQMTISDSGRVFQVPVKVVEKKRMKTVLGKVDAIRVDPNLFGPDRILAAKGELSIWMTDDRRHIPVKARIKTEYGTFEITLKKAIQNPPPDFSRNGS